MSHLLTQYLLKDETDFLLVRTHGNPQAQVKKSGSSGVFVHGGQMWTVLAPDSVQFGSTEILPTGAGQQLQAGSLYQTGKIDFWVGEAIRGTSPSQMGVSAVTHSVTTETHIADALYLLTSLAWYEIPDSAIFSFLREFPGIIPLLRDATPIITRYFGVGPKSVALESRVWDDNNAGLVGYIKTSLPVEKVASYLLNIRRNLLSRYPNDLVDRVIWDAEFE